MTAQSQNFNNSAKLISTNFTNILHEHLKTNPYTRSSLYYLTPMYKGVYVRTILTFLGAHTTLQPDV